MKTLQTLINEAKNELLQSEGHTLEECGTCERFVKLLESKMELVAKESLGIFRFKLLSGCQCHICPTSRCKCGIEYHNQVLTNLHKIANSFLEK